jgi:[ribosomal protein S18]-alanine N-acetyltransferase
VQNSPMSAILKPQSDSMLSVHDAQWQPMFGHELQDVMLTERACYEFPWSEGNFQDSIRSGYRCMNLRSGKGELIGYSVTMRGVDEVHLLNITVAPAHQRCGWARVLLDDVVIASREQAQWIWLEVRQSNARAIHLYSRYGFRQVGLRKGYYPAAQSRREDAVIMSLKL